MDIWIIRNGEKVGPIHDFEIRRKIDEGDLEPDTPAWHDGLAEWRPLNQIDLFTREFELVAAAKAPKPEVMPAVSEAKLTPIKPTTHYGRRFWARWFDLVGYAGIWWFVMWACRQDIGAALANPWIVFFQYVPWFVFESFLLQRFGTTPGKWLLGLRIANDDGSNLDLAAATRRSARVLLTGIGFGWMPLAFFCHALSYFTARRLGKPLWDHLGKHTMKASPLHPAKVIALVGVFYAALQLQAIVVYPYMVESASESMPWLKEQFEKNPSWHLPKRSKTATDS